MSELNEVIVQVSDICPVCKKQNKNTWVICKVNDKQVKICKPCKLNLDTQPALNSTHYERNKARMIEERRKANSQVLRDYRIKPVKP